MQPIRREDDGSKTGPDSSLDLSTQMKALKVQEDAVKAEAPAVVAKDECEEARRPLLPEDKRRVMATSMCPEDIVLCVDIGPEMGCIWAGGGVGGASTTRMRVVQSALTGFIRRKSSFNHRVLDELVKLVNQQPAAGVGPAGIVSPLELRMSMDGKLRGKHRFALCTMNEGVQIVRSLTSDVRSVQEAIERLQPTQWPETPIQDEPPFDFSELLECIAERFSPLNHPSEEPGGAGLGAGSIFGAASQIHPVVRALVVYGRSYTCPLVPISGVTPVPLLSHGRFYLDCVYLHRNPSEEDVVCQEAFDLIAAMETKGGGSHSYLLECSHNLQRFNSNMATLLAHPVQRDYQDAFFDKLEGGAGAGDAGSATPGGFRGSPSRAQQASAMASNSVPIGSASP